MRFSTMTLGALLLATTAAPAFAQDAAPTQSAAATEAAPPTAPPSEFTINGTAAVVSDYRFRGVSQTDKGFALQGSITVTHASGFYLSAWGSSTSGYVVAGGNARQEIDLIGGYSHTFTGGLKLDGGVLYYFYPRDPTPGVHSDFFEPYIDVSKTFGPFSAKATVNYAPKQKALKLDQSTGPSHDNVYAAGDFSVGVPKTPLSLTAHIGHTFGPSWLANDTLGKTEYTDWGLGVTATYKVLTLGLSYVDTDADFLYTPSNTKKVSNLAGSGVVASLTASF